MIISDKTVGYSSVRGSPFSNRKGFSSRRPSNSTTEAYTNSDATVTESLIDNRTIYRLKNSKVDFILRGDDITGVRIDKFKSANSSNYFINKSRVLWELCIRRKTEATNPLETYVDVYYIRPSKECFIPISTSPSTSSGGTKSFSFVWRNVKYDYSNPNRTANITLVASLGRDSEYVEMSLKVQSNQPFEYGSLSICVSGVGMPGLSIRKSGTSDHQEQDFFSLPLLEGQTILNPIKRLQYPRFENESLQYNELATKNYFGTSVYGFSPYSNTHRGTFGHPGLLNIPLFMFGNREDKDGFLYYAFDSEGIHAKNFQVYSNGSTLNLKCYDLSDHEVEPYGVGGKDLRKNLYNIALNETNVDADNIVQPVDAEEIPSIPLVTYGNTINQIGWTIRIQPFKSPTRWVDWYGSKLYKNTVVPDLEEYGVVPKSFYNRYEDGDISSILDVEIPICSLSFGHLSGDASQLFSGVYSLQEYFSGTTSKNLPRALNLYYEPSLNANPIPSSTTGLDAYYHGWEPWADGTLSGVGIYKSPDMSGINSVYSGAVGKSIANSQYAYNYLLFPFNMSSGSLFTITNSGLDLSTRSLYLKDTVTTSGNYAYYEQNTSSSLTGAEFSICPSSYIGFKKYKDILSGINEDGSFVYDDTLGNWGRGCYAHNHTFYDVETSGTITYSHPKGRFTYFFNKLQRDWLTGSRSSESNLNSNWFGPTGSALSLSHGSEYPCDINLNHAGFSLLYNPITLTANTYFTPLTLTNPLYSGACRSDALFGTLYDVNWDNVSIEAKNWNQLNPIYSTVYGDRSILLDLMSPWVSNYLDVSGLFGRKPGAENIYGYPDADLITHAERQIQIKNWIAGHFNQYTRITCSAVSSQYSGLNTGYTNKIDNTIADSLAKSTWTGLRSYTSKIMRLLAYAPDYMYHGTLENPLESWNVSNSDEGYIARGIRTTRIPNYSGWEAGDDTVMHGVKRHRSNGGIIIWLNNWYSGSQSFSGTFDPTVYEFTKGYNAYSLSLEDSDYGLLTDLGKYSKRDTFSISDTVPENSIYAYIFEPIGSVNTIDFLDLTVDFTYLRYEYGQQELSKNSSSIVYDYGCSVSSEVDRPIIGANAPATQSIVNNLPPWMEGRQNTSSNMWKLVNSWGQNFETLVERSTEFISNKFLVTSNKTKRSLINYTDIVDPSLLQPRTYNNLLFNSSFAIKAPSRYKMPSGWSNYAKDTSNTRLNIDNAYICPGSIVIEGSGKFGQSVFLNGTSVKDLTCSIYLLADTSNIELSMITIVETIEGYLISKQSDLSSRSSEWRRLTHTLNINAKVYRIQFIVVSKSDGAVYFNAPMIEEASKVSKWKRSYLDNLQYINGASPFNQTLVIGNDTSSNRKIPVYSVGSEAEFMDISIPTRIESIAYTKNGLESFTTNIHGRKVSFHKEIYDTQWVIFDNKVQLRSFTGSEFDIFREFSIRDLQYNSELIYGTYEEDNYSYELLLLTVREGYLYILCRENYFDRVEYVIKVIPAIDPYGDRGYLESIIDFKILLPVNENNYTGELSEEAIGIAFSDIDPSIMVITTNLSRQFYYKLYFDYQYFLPANNRVYTVENYSGLKVNIT